MKFLNFSKQLIYLNLLADRAKQIRTRAIVNENPIEKLVRELKGETQRIKATLTRGNIDPQWLKTVVNGRQSNPKGIRDYSLF